jgi:hypothetical protein
LAVVCVDAVLVVLVKEAVQTGAVDGDIGRVVRVARVIGSEVRNIAEELVPISS